MLLRPYVEVSAVEAFGAQAPYAFIICINFFIMHLCIVNSEFDEQ